MNNKINYNNENYIVLKNIVISKTEFAILINEQYNKVIYLKVNYIGERPTYVLFRNIIKVLPDYQNPASYNKLQIMECFIKVMNMIISSSKFINFDILINCVNNFNDYLHKNEIFYYTEKKIDYNIPEDILRKFAKKFNLVLDKILYNKFCGAYAIMVIVSAVGMMICFGEYSEWKQSSIETKSIMDDILSTVEIDYGNSEEQQHLNEVLSTQNDSNGQAEYATFENRYSGSDYEMYKSTSMMNVDFSSLLQRNMDTVAWLYVNNTNINYPVVQTTNNEYYLKHSFDGSYSLAGWIFADYRADLTNFKRNNVIYGHGRGVDHVMFGSLLDNALNESWYTNEANQYIKLSTPTKNTVWKIFSIYSIQQEAYYLTHNFESDDSFRAYLNTIVGRSIYNFNSDINVNDKVLTLSTCLDTNGNRIVVHAKLVREEAR